MVKGGIATAVVLPLIIWGIVSEKKEFDLKNQIRDCRAEVLLLGAEIDVDTTKLKRLDEELAKYRDSGDIEHYNNLVAPYNSLLREVKEETSQYGAKRAVCKGLIDQYNERR